MLIQNTIVSPRRVEVVVCVGGITLLGAVLRFANLGFKSLWLDEAVTYWAAAGDLLSVLRETALGTSGGPLFNVALWFVVPFSSSEEALRLLPCLAGIAAIPVTYFRLLTRICA